MAIIDPYTTLQSFLDAPKYIDAYSQAHDIGSKYPHNISSTSKYDKQGLSSDVRHTLGSAAGKEAIIDWSSANLGIDPYGKFANVIGNVGITGATALEEIPDAWRSFTQALGEKDYGAITSGGIFAQPWEDVQANLNAWGIPYGASLEEKKAAALPTYDEFWGGEKVSVGDKINAFQFKQQQVMNKKKQDMQRRIRKAEKKRIEQEKIKAAQDNWKPTYNPASSHAEAKSTGGDYHSDTRSTVDGQTTEWGDELFSRGGLAQYAPRGSYFDGGLASLWLR